jgi:hypothetical protein
MHEGLLDEDRLPRPSFTAVRSAALARGLGRDALPPRAAPPTTPRVKGKGTFVLWMFFLQILSVLLFVVLSFVLPNHVPYLTGDNAAIHISALHSCVFFVVVGMWLVIRAFDFAAAPRNFPLNRNLAELNAIVCILANAILLLCLGVEDWVKQQADHYDFSVLGVVQCLGVGEFALVALSGAGCLWRCILYLNTPVTELVSGAGAQAAAYKLSSSAAAPAAAAFPGGAPPETPRPTLPGGSAVQRLQEVRRTFGCARWRAH